MRNRLWLVKYEDAYSAEQKVCVVVSPTEQMVPKFMQPHDVLQVILLDEMDLEVVHERFGDYPIGGVDTGNPGGDLGGQVGD